MTHIHMLKTMHECQSCLGLLLPLVEPGVTHTAITGAGALQSPEMRQLLEGAAGPGSRPARPQVAIVFVCPAGLKTLAAFSQPVSTGWWHAAKQHRDVPWLCCKNAATCA
jgi:hypothetical protein